MRIDRYLQGQMRMRVIEYKLNGGPSAKTIDSDDGALVQVALNGADGFVAYPKAKYPVTPLGEFLKEIRGEETIINTADVLRTSREVLTDAMDHPEKYPALVVRVSGFSEYYVRLAREVQLDILSRTQHE